MAAFTATSHAGFADAGEKLGGGGEEQVICEYQLTPKHLDRAEKFLTSKIFGKPFMLMHLDSDARPEALHRLGLEGLRPADRPHLMLFMQEAKPVDLTFGRVAVNAWQSVAQPKLVSRLAGWNHVEVTREQWKGSYDALMKLAEPDPRSSEFVGGYLGEPESDGTRAFVSVYSENLELYDGYGVTMGFDVPCDRAHEFTDMPEGELTKVITPSGVLCRAAVVWFWRPVHGDNGDE